MEISEQEPSTGGAARRLGFSWVGKTGLLLALVGGVWWWMRPPADPIYKGKRLSERVGTLRNGFGARELSRKDLLRIGQPGVKWLTYAVEHGRHGETSFRNSIHAHSPRWLQARLPEEWGVPPGQSERDERVDAAVALEMLGTGAVPAIPALVRMLHSQGGSEAPFYLSSTRTFYAMALQATGTASWPAVEQCLTHGSMDEQRILIATMPNRLRIDGKPVPKTECQRVVDTLLRATHHPQAEVRRAAAKALGECRWNIDTEQTREGIILALMPLFGDPVYSVGTEAVETLLIFKPEARRYISRLIELLDDANPNVRALSATALGKLGGPARKSVPRLQAMIADPEPICRASARDALAALEKVPDHDRR